MIRLIKAFTEEIRYIRDDGQWTIEFQSASVSDQCNSWADETNNVVLDLDVTLSVKESMDQQRSVRYVHLIVTYMPLDKFVKSEVLLRKLAMSAQGVDEVMSNQLKKAVNEATEQAQNDSKDEKPEAAPEPGKVKLKDVKEKLKNE